ncbi:restriction endonuclease subunit S [Lactococcus formosensis]|nr:restriction endonuclease subunit S [Lactococcus formosensis]MDG6163253.1 restriction endonuclease subunit S [Lactococcus formosensis]
MSKKSPQLRFKGFTDDWEDRNLKDILREFSTKSKIENEYRVLSSTNVGMEFRDGRVSGTSNLGYKIIKNGDLVLSPQNLWLGNININDIGTGLVSPSYKTFNFTDIDSSFIKPQLRTPKMLEEYKNSSTQGASVVRRNLEIDSFYQIKIATPSIKEQEKIGSFFAQLDNTIALHQRKLDLLKEQKKGYLQKMFPKNGEKVPELRFAGFADDWEERKLGEVFNQTVEYINPNEANLELWSVTVERGLTPKTARYNREALVKKNDKFKVVHDGDIVYNPMNLTIGAVGFNKSEKSVAVSGYYVTMNMNSGFNNSYFQTWLKSENAIKQYKLYATGSLIEKQRVQFPTLSLIKSYIPTFEEQQKIGSFFKQIDETIALHQRKLDLLKEQKKGFLQKMFV